jgi:hypothetical protein
MPWAGFEPTIPETNRPRPTPQTARQLWPANSALSIANYDNYCYLYDTNVMVNHTFSFLITIKPLSKLPTMDGVMVSKYFSINTPMNSFMLTPRNYAINLYQYPESISISNAFPRYHIVSIYRWVRRFLNRCWDEQINWERDSCIAELVWSIYLSEMWKLQSANNETYCISRDDCGRTLKQVQFSVRLCRRRTELNSRVSSLPRPSYHHGNTQPPQCARCPRSKHVHFSVIMLKWKRLRTSRFASVVMLQY